MYKELNDLLLLDGISGYEKSVFEYIKNYGVKLCNFRIETDNIGSIFLVKKSKITNAPKVMIAGHMDEVGLIVIEILKNGLLKLTPIGGLDKNILTSQVLYVHANDKKISGVVPSIPPHLSAFVQGDEIYLDIGAKDYDEVINSGVKLGNMVTFPSCVLPTLNSKRFISKAIDNRFGCAMALLIAKKYNDIELPIDLIVGATVQEEVGLRGATTSTKKFAPDVFIALDASPVNDVLDPQFSSHIGDGFLIRMFDPRNTIQRGLLEFFVETARKHNIRYQHFTSKGGTDAAAALDQLGGVLATTIGLPARYIHSNAAVFDLNDFEAAKKMIFKVIDTLDIARIQKIKDANR